MSEILGILGVVGIVVAIFMDGNNNGTFLSFCILLQSIAVLFLYLKLKGLL